MDPIAVLDMVAAAALRGGIYASVAVGLSLIFGVMNISNFAHGEFYMIGAVAAHYAYAILGLGPLLSILAGAFSGLLAGTLCEKLLFQGLF